MSRLSDLLRGEGVDALLREHPDAIYAFDAEGRFIDCNDALCEMFHMTREEILSGRFAPLVAPSHLEHTTARFADALAGAVQRYVSKGVRPDGVTFDVEVTNFPVHDEAGRTIAVIGLARDVTRQVQANDRARARRAMTKMVSALARVAGWSIDVASGLLGWNENVFVILGMPPAGPLPYEETLRPFPEGERELVQRAIERCIATGDSFDVMTHARHHDGTMLEVRVMGEAVRDEEGRVVRVVGAFHDVTALIEQRQMVERLERRIVETISRIPSVAIFLDREWRLEFANDVAYQLLGVTSDEALGRDIRVVVPRFIHGAMYPSLVRAMDEGTYSLQTVWAERLEAWYDVQALPGHDGIVIHARNVTSEYRARQELEESTERARLFAEVVEMTNEAVIVNDFEAGITSWNRSAEELYGWRFDEVRARDVRDVLYPPDSSIDEVLALARRDGFWMGEIDQRTKSGEPITVEMRLRLIRDAAGDERGIFGLHRDITTQKLERELRARNQRIESIGTLASGMAHDLNNILTPVLLTLEVLEREQTDEARRRQIQSVESSVQRGAEMIRQVLAYARGVERVREVVQLESLIDDVLRLTRETFAQPLDLRVHVDAPLWPVLGDATQLMQVVINLITNARDAMPDGGRLEVSARNGYGSDAGRVLLDRDGEYSVYVEVTDTGVGMDSAVLARIFEPFYSTKSFGAGTGLGLSTSAAIAKSHGGRIEVDSVPGRGSRFALVLPAHLESFNPNLSIVERERVVDVSSVGLGCRVLVVDDEPNIVTMFQELLRGVGYDVDVAGDGREALRLVEAAEREYDVIVTDLNMPFMSGEQLAAVLRDRKVRTRFIFMSGLSVTPDSTLAAVVRDATFLAKPFTSNALISAVNRAAGLGG